MTTKKPVEQNDFSSFDTVEEKTFRFRGKGGETLDFTLRTDIPDQLINYREVLAKAFQVVDAEIGVRFGGTKEALLDSKN